MNKYKWAATRLIFVAVIILISLACSLINPLMAEQNPTATPPPYPADWQLLLADNFDDNSNEWGSMVPEDAVGIIDSKVENGLLNVTLRSKEQGARNSVFQSKITHLKDFYISFQADQKESEGDAYYGLEFRTINMQGYVFMIDQKKSQYSLAFADARWNPIIEITASTAITSDKPNKIGLLINGSKITMFINDQEIASITDSRSDNSGTFGFTAGLYNPNGKMNVSFDNLQIYGPSSPSHVPTLTRGPLIATATMPVAVSTMIASTLISPTPADEALPISTPSVKIVGHENPASSRLELWLEFAFLPGDILPGSQIESDLNNGSLELTLPSGEKKAYERVPHSPNDSEITGDVWLPEGIGVQMSPPPAGTLPLNGLSFENYTDTPGGPQIRAPIETLSEISTKGQYQIAWQSGRLRSNTATFEWDGSRITIHEP